MDYFLEKKQGEWIFFDKGGSVSAKINYEDGEPIGQYTTFRERTQIIEGL